MHPVGIGSLPLLQRGRDPKTAETRDNYREHPDNYLRFNGAAIQRPRRRGTQGQVEYELERLQRGRDPKTAETAGLLSPCQARLYKRVLERS